MGARPPATAMRTLSAEDPAAFRASARSLDRGIAESWADRMTGVAESDAKNLVLLLADMVRSRPPMSTARYSSPDSTTSTMVQSMNASTPSISGLSLRLRFHPISANLSSR